MRRFAVLSGIAVMSFFFALPAIPAAAGTTVSGHITQNTTWNLAGSPYTVSAPWVQVDAGVTLTISPGVKVAMSPSTSLFINGALNAVGTGSSGILFTSASDPSVGGAGGAAPGDWKRVMVEGTGSMDLEYATVRYGGGDTQISDGEVNASDTATLTMDNDTVKQSLSSGLYVSRSSQTTVQHTLFGSNYIGIYLFDDLGDESTVTASNNTLKQNTSDGVYVLLTSSFNGQDSFTYNTIKNNDDYGVFLLNDAQMPQPSNSFPLGQNNNIYSNGSNSYKQLALYSPRPLQTRTWTKNYWGTDVAGPNYCPWAGSLYPYHTFYTTSGSVPPKGPVSFTTWTDPNTGLKCGADDIPVNNYSTSLIPNEAP